MFCTLSSIFILTRLDSSVILSMQSCFMRVSIERMMRMANKPKVEVIRESNTGRNERFRDTRTSNEMTRNQFIKAIDRGDYGNDYYHRKINGIDTPVSKPDGNPRNNLG